MRSRLSLIAALALAAGACGADETCKAIVAGPPGASCVQGAAQPLELCLSNRSRLKKDVLACLVNPSGQLLVTVLPQGGRFQKDEGWRHSNVYPLSSTLTAMEQSACEQLAGAVSTNIPWCPGSGPGAFYWE